MRFSSLVVLGFIALPSTMITAAPSPADAVPAKNEADDTANLVHNLRNSVAASSNAFHREMLSFNETLNHRELNAGICQQQSNKKSGNNFTSVCECEDNGSGQVKLKCKDTCEQCFDDNNCWLRSTDYQYDETGQLVEQFEYATFTNGNLTDSVHWKADLDLNVPIQFWINGEECDYVSYYNDYDGNKYCWNLDCPGNSYWDSCVEWYQEDNLIANTTYWYFHTPEYMTTVGVCSSSSPTVRPSLEPSDLPSLSPSFDASTVPSFSPSVETSSLPSLSPSFDASTVPSFSQTLATSSPSPSPTVRPSLEPSDLPSFSPSLETSSVPSLSPSLDASLAPSASPSSAPSLVLDVSDLPSFSPSLETSSVPSLSPSLDASLAPSASPSSAPSLVLSGTIYKFELKFFVKVKQGRDEDTKEKFAVEENKPDDSEVLSKIYNYFYGIIESEKMPYCPPDVSILYSKLRGAKHQRKKLQISSTFYCESKRDLRSLERKGMKKFLKVAKYLSEEKYYGWSTFKFETFKFKSIK